MYYYNARHYDPEVARFVTADSVTDGPSTIKGWNRYMYVGGNPIMYKDPTGHEGKSEGGFFGAMGDVMSAIFGGSESSDTSEKKIQPSEVVNEKRKPEDITIYLDVGHGGSCGKKCNGGGGLSDNYPEKDLNLQNAKILQRHLEKKGYKVVLSRTESVEKGVPKGIRDEYANRAGADYMISVHFNHDPNSKGSSMLSIHHTSPKKIESVDFARNFAASMRRRKPDEMAVKVYVDRYNHIDNADMPAMILELGNNRSEEDKKRMYHSKRRRDFLKDVAESLHESITVIEQQKAIQNNNGLQGEQ